MKRRAATVCEVAITVAMMESQCGKLCFHWHLYYHVIMISLFLLFQLKTNA